MKNRNYEKNSNSFEQRNFFEINYFRKSNFFILFKKCVEITFLKNRLNQLFFDHVKQKFSKLRKNFEKVFTNTQFLLKSMNNSKITSQKCKKNLIQFNLNFYKIDKIAINEHYEKEYFVHNIDHIFSTKFLTTIRKLRIFILLKCKKHAL